jgi:hypothetical protein
MEDDWKELAVLLGAFVLMIGIVALAESCQATKAQTVQAVPHD